MTLPNPENIEKVLDPEAMRDVTEHPGYFGHFSRHESQHGYKNGARIRKAWSEPGDTTPDGYLGTILGSMAILMKDGSILMAYWLEWDHTPKVGVFCMGPKIEAV